MQAGDWILPPASADAFRLQQRQGKREELAFTEQPSERRRPRSILRGLYSRQHLRDATALPDGDMGYGREIGRPLKLVKSLTGRGVRTCDHPSASGRDKYRHVTVEKHRHSPSSTLITRQPLKKAHNAPAPKRRLTLYSVPNLTLAWHQEYHCSLMHLAKPAAKFHLEQSSFHLCQMEVISN
jgi:hypothetical protein